VTKYQYQTNTKWFGIGLVWYLLVYFGLVWYEPNTKPKPNQSEP
jgi:hypothetical protein